MQMKESFNLHSASNEISKSDSMVQFPNHVLHVAMQSDSWVQQDGYGSPGSIWKAKRLIAVHASFIDEALDTFGALPPKA